MKIPKKLFVLEMANNHMGDVNHGIKIIEKFSQITKKYPFSFGFKLQYRNLNTFIHKDLRNRNDIKYIKRFNETRLKEQEFKKLIQKMREKKFIPICTPFDENSVDTIDRHNFDIIKIASCSFNDWLLIEKIAKSNKPIIASTAGAPLDKIEKVVNFFKNRNKNFVLMHCVAEYPTPNNRLNLSRLNFLINRFPDIRIGYSTHEDPNDSSILPLAIAMGASVFEKHVGFPTKEYPLNNYSSSPQQVEKWLNTAMDTYERCGKEKNIFSKNNNEINNLQSLQRGIFLKKSKKIGESINKEDIYLAFPPQKNQLTADKFSKYLKFFSKKKIYKDQPLLKSNCTIKDMRGKIWKIVKKTKKMLEKANQFLKGKYYFEISHHYGLEEFNKFGLVMLTIINRKYCKKLLVLFPGQTHPEQYHKKKRETFRILDGKIKLKLDGKQKQYSEGALITINPGVKHEFSSRRGSVIEEISTPLVKGDSFYSDKRIMNNLKRKTEITYYWDYDYWEN